MTRLVLKDDLLDAQALRALGTAYAGGADVGEVLVAARACADGRLSTWYDTWSALAARVRTLADQECAAGRLRSARDAYLRATTYDRTAGVMLLGPPVDPRLREAYRRQTASFRAAAELLPHAVEVVEIPYETTTLPGYLLCPEGAGTGVTFVLVGGYDGTAEELYLQSGAAAVACGHRVLMFDGPGQGAALLEQGLTMRHDWEAVLTPVLDWLFEQPDIDPSRVVLMGMSLGAYLAPRAAAYEHRLAACIADCGSYDLYQQALGRIPAPLRPGLADPAGLRGAALARILDRVAARPTGGWAIRRGMLVHGVDSPVAYLRALTDYRLAGHAQRITCPTLVCQAEGDDISASAPQLVAALTCPKEHIVFRAADGAGDHCEAGARELFLTRALAWVDRVLG